MQYSDEQRVIFRYYNGETEVFGDPLRLYRQILAMTAGKPTELSEKVFIDLSKASPQDILASGEANDKLVAIVRQVFQMKPFNPVDGTGAMEAHCHAAWRELATFLSIAKKKEGNSPTASSPSVGPQVSLNPTPSMSA